MTPLVIVPARVGSKGVPNKNFALLPDGSTLTERACMIGLAFGEVVLTTDNEGWAVAGCHYHLRPAALATDTATMADVVRDVLAAYPGPDEQPILLLQPTTPFRRREVVQEGLSMLTPRNDSIASVYAVPEPFLPDRVLVKQNSIFGPAADWPTVTRRQDARRAYVRDGQCYAFRRDTIEYWDWTFFQELVIVPDDQVNVDSPSDWEEACRRIRATSAVRP